MKLVDVGVVQGRVNSALLILEKNQPAETTLEDIKAELLELRAGLDFYAEAHPLTVAPGLVKRRVGKKKKKTTRRGKRRPLLR